MRTLVLAALIFTGCLAGQKGPADQCKESLTVQDVCIASNQDCGEVDCNGEKASCGKCDVDHVCNANNRCIHP